MPVTVGSNVAMMSVRMTRNDHRNVYIKNLNKMIDSDHLARTFSSYGHVTSAKVMKNDNGESRGFGFVCFAAPAEAVKAIREANGRTDLVVDNIWVAVRQLYLCYAEKK